MKICSACGHALTPEGPCGFASITTPTLIGVTVVDKTTYLCHADDHWCGVGVTAPTNEPLPDAAEGTGETDSHGDPQYATAASDAVQGRPIRHPLVNGWDCSRPSPGATDGRIEAIERFLEEQLDAPFTWAVGILAAVDAADPLRVAVRAFLDHWDAFVGDDDIVVLRVTAVAELRAALWGER